MDVGNGSVGWGKGRRDCVQVCIRGQGHPSLSQPGGDGGAENRYENSDASSDGV